MHDEVSIEKKLPNRVDGTLRKFALRVPECIYKCSGIIVFGKRIKSLVFSTDLSIIRNVNADAILAVYPFTPQPVITQALLTAADIPVFSGVGGGLTQGQRAINLAMFAEMQGATGVVLNDPTSNEVLSLVRHTVDIPVVVTVARKETDFEARLKAGADIFNVSAASDTPDLVRRIKDAHPDVPVIATGGPTEESIMKTIDAGANAITWTPPSNGEVFRDIMAKHQVDCFSYEQVRDSHTFHDYRQIVLGLLREHPETDGIFCNDLCAAAVLNAAMSLQLRVPDQLKIIGYDGTFLSEIVTPSITTVWQNTEKIASSAADIIVKMIDDPSFSSYHLTLGVRLIERDSTRCG